MYVIKFYLDGDEAIEGALYSCVTNEYIMFCEDLEVWENLFTVLDDFVGTRLDGYFYRALEVCGECNLEEGNYRLNIIHSDADLQSVQEAYKFLLESEVI